LVTIQFVLYVPTMPLLVVHSTQNQPAVDCLRGSRCRVMETPRMNDPIVLRLHVRRGPFHFQLHNFLIVEQEQRRELPVRHSMTN